MFKDLLARFKKVLTVAEWKQEAQGAIREKEFVIESLAELHRVEKADAAQAQERIMQRQPIQQGRAPMQGAPNMRGSQGMPMPMNGGMPMTPPTVAYGDMSPAARNQAMRRDDDRRDKDRKKSELSLADLMNQIKQQQQQIS